MATEISAMDVRHINGYESITDEEAECIVEYLKQLSYIIYSAKLNCSKKINTNKIEFSSQSIKIE